MFGQIAMSDEVKRKILPDRIRESLIFIVLLRHITTDTIFLTLTLDGCVVIKAWWKGIDPWIYITRLESIIGHLCCFVTYID